MKLRSSLNSSIVLAALIMMAGGGAVAKQELGAVTASYLYTLSNFTGIYRISSAKMDVDESKNEVYVVSSTKVKVFDENGMEVFSFNEGAELGTVVDIAVDGRTGDIFVLSSRPGVARIEIIRCNYRGEQISTIEPKDLPPDFSDFSPHRIVLRGNLFYLANTNDMKVVVIDDTGAFQKGFDVARLIESDLTEKEKEKEKQDYGMAGFSVDRDGNVLLANSNMARVFRLSLDGELRSFGVRGSTAGKFGVPVDVIADATGNYLLVSDVLRCVILVFDKDFRFQSEFGIRGLKPDNLIGPTYMAVDAKNRLYVSQLRNRGVNVYQISGS